jgi:hypothetical protein
MIRKTADKIVSYKTVSDRVKVDRLLELNAKQYTNLGTDSSKQERALAESNSRYIYRKIKTVNPIIGIAVVKSP